MRVYEIKVLNGLGKTFLLLITTFLSIGTNTQVGGNGFPLKGPLQAQLIEIVPDQTKRVLKDLGKAGRGAQVRNIDDLRAKILEKGKYLIFYPSKMIVSNKRWPLIIWFNGAGGSSDIKHLSLSSEPARNYDDMLRSIASHGFVVIANREAGYNKGLEEMVAQNTKPESIFYQKLDENKIGIAGYSLGGKEVLDLVGEARIKANVVHAPYGGGKGNGNPTLYIAGREDYWCPPARVEETYEMSEAVAFYIEHATANHTYIRGDGGDWREPTIAFFRWILVGDEKGKSWFVGKGCKLCSSDTWKIKAKNSDKLP